MPGITAAPRDNENPYGLTVTLEGGSPVWWAIADASPAGSAADSGLHEVGPVPVPDLTRRPIPAARIEQALVAIAQAGDTICSIDRYSSRPDPPAVRYGATIGFRDGWKLFMSCYGTTRPGQPRPGQPRPGRPYHSASHI